MKILFTVYKEEYDTGERMLEFTKTILTDMNIEEIDNGLQLYEGFHSVLEVGDNLTFWDIYCFWDITQDIIERINNISISKMSTISQKEPNVLHIEEYNPGNADTPCYPDRSKCFMYRLTRYECGASGFNEIVIWASNHPWLMVFIGGFIWDITKSIFTCIGKVLNNILGHKKNTRTIREHKQTVYFAVAKFYHNFSKMANLDKADCQIVYLKRIRGGNFEVHVRTVKNEHYVVKCTCSGKINFLNLEDMSTNEIE